MMRTFLLDAGFIIDLLSAGLMAEVWIADCRICATQPTMAELKKATRKMFAIAENSLKIVDEGALEKILKYAESLPPGLSFADVSVLFCARKLHADILTSDRKLADAARGEGLQTYDIRCVIGSMVKNGTLRDADAREKLRILKERNRMLFKEAADKDERART